MFFTIKIDKYKIGFLIIILLIMAIVGGVGYKLFGKISNPKTKNNIDPEINRKIIQFIENYGWEVEENPVDVEEFQFPDEFNVIYKRYNQYQLEIGKDLTKYKGSRVKRYTYKVTNYKVPPQFEGQQVYADVLMHGDEIIGGDLKTNELNGFMVSLNNKTFKEITGVEEWEYN